MKKRNILLASLAILIFSTGLSSVKANEEENVWTEVEKGSEEIAIDKFTAFEELLAKRVNELNLSSINSNTNELYRYRIEVTENEATENYKKISNDKTFASEEEATAWASENEPQKEGWSFLQNIIKTIKLDEVYKLTRFETKEEAEEAKNNFESNIDENSGSVTITEIRDEEGDITTSVENNNKFNSFDDATKASEELRENTHDYVITAEVIKQNPEYEKTEKINISLTFDTKKEAEDYISSLKNEGYTVTTKIEEVYENNTLNKIYEEKQAAEEELANFLATYPDAITSNIEELRDTTEDKTTTTTSDKEYSTEEEANSAANALEEDNHNYQITATTRKESKTVQNETITIASEQFDTKLEAQNYIDTLKEQGYDVSNLEIELVPFEESIWKDEDGVIVNPGESDGKNFTYRHFDITLITTFTKIDAEGNKTTVNGSVAINSVKINNSNIAMSNLSKDPNTGLYEYTSKERNKLNVTNKSLVEINGTVTFNNTTLPFSISGYLSESQNVCGGKGNSKGYDLEFESITIINNKVVVDTNIINKYKVTGTATKTITQDVWYVDTTTKIKGYDYQVTANSKTITGYSTTGIATKDIYHDVYTLEVKKTIKDYDYEVEGSGSKTYYDVISEYVKLANVEWIIESTTLGKGGDTEVEVLPPQTGVIDTSTNTNIISILVSSIIGLFLLIKKSI